MKATILFLSTLAAGFAQMQDNTQPALNCDNNNSRGRQSRHCEMQEQTIPYAGQLNIDGKENGGVSVKGWSRADVLVRMRVEASAETDSDARALSSQVRVTTSAGRIYADGPAQARNSNWSVSYEVFAPHQSNVQITTHNGGVHLQDLRGNIQFAAVNGGVHMARVDGSVKGQTTNGGVHVELAGSRWEGTGMDVQTTNGGVHVEVPSNYSAALDTSTVNGGLHSDFGISEQAKKEGRLKANLGGGGALLHIVTTNGGVHVAKM